jgi:hypothetical protein
MAAAPLPTMLRPIAPHQPEVMAALLEFPDTGYTDPIQAQTALPTPDFGVPDFPRFTTSGRAFATRAADDGR